MLRSSCADLFRASTSLFRAGERGWPAPRPAMTTEVGRKMDLSKPHRRGRFEAEQELPDGLEMLLAPLQLLRDRVDIAKAPLERVLFEDRGRSGGVIGGVDDLQRLVNGKGRGEPDRHALVDGDMAGALDRGGDLLERAQQKGAGSGEPRFGLCDLRLDQVVVAQGTRRTERHLVARQFDKGVERAAGDPHRHPGKSGRVELEAAEAIEQTLLAPG